LGGRAQMALILSLTKAGIPAHSSGIAITLAADLKQRLVDALKALAQGSAPDAVELAHLVPDMVRAKYDCYLGDDLLALDYASERIEADRVPSIAADLLSGM
ncbi:hypothetical protein, partial [Leclercia adecarboxylata]|uniref:hypothetical protein n=1 Tax=Leclercia adecarboxylata TaxID=83655 RepID=UPI00234C6797